MPPSLFHVSHQNRTIWPKAVSSYASAAAQPLHSAPFLAYYQVPYYSEVRLRILEKQMILLKMARVIFLKLKGLKLSFRITLYPEFTLRRLIVIGGRFVFFLNIWDFQVYGLNIINKILIQIAFIQTWMFKKSSQIFYNLANTTKNHIKNRHITVFSSKGYDQKYFQSINKTLPNEKQFTFDFLESEYSNRMANLIPETSNTVCCFVNDKLDASGIKALKEHNVNLIALRCAGFNNVDLKEAEKEGIKVVRVPAYSPHAVAEHTMALVMTLNRKIHKAYNRTRENNFALDGLLGFDMYGKTVGIVGFGKIGQEFSKICNGYGMKVLVNDVFTDNQEQMQKTLNVKFVDLNTILTESDIISLHCPLTTQTEDMINRKTLKKVKKNCIIVNTGRGNLIQTVDVIKALQEEKLGGLALDVYEQEQGIFFTDHSNNILKDTTLSLLLSFPNVLLTSHQAFFTHEALTQISSVTLNNVNEFIETGQCKNQVKIKPK